MFFEKSRRIFGNYSLEPPEFFALTISFAFPSVLLLLAIPNPFDWAVKAIFLSIGRMVIFCWLAGVGAISAGVVWSAIKKIKD
ncbi:MAG: hypothetical protein NT136_03590 [Candidatus Moranbacteria bacterium]|nr:hypothetical protein [Candidatus Moranbacteria bacterium]